MPHVYPKITFWKNSGEKEREKRREKERETRKEKAKTVISGWSRRGETVSNANIFFLRSPPGDVNDGDNFPPCFSIGITPLSPQPALPPF